MRVTQELFKTYLVIAVIAPMLFVGGMALYFSEFVIGEAYRVDTGGALGFAANLSLSGLTAAIRIGLTLGPYFLILVGLALPVLGAMYSLDRVDTYRTTVSASNRAAVWGLACAETFVMLGAFVLVFQA